MKIKTKISIAIFSIFALCSLVSFAAVNEGNFVEAYGTDTIAGHATVIRTSKTMSNVILDLVLVKPNGESLKFETVTNTQGVAYFELSDYQTRVAGSYGIYLQSNGESLGSGNSFEVYPGLVSRFKSEITPLKQVVNLGDEKAEIKVKLLDDYGNPIANHNVRLVSSVEDEVDFISDSLLTDEKGEAEFFVRSKIAGPVSYTLYDVTEDVILAKRARVVYFDSSEEVFSYSKPTASFAAFGNASGPIDHFGFEDVPDEIYPAQEISVKIRAYDSKDQVVSNYNGKVRFIVSGDNANQATVPKDYTFLPEDQGEHTFSLAFAFKELGSYKIKVTDLQNTAVFGEKTFQILPKTSADAVKSSSSIILSSPAAGTYSNNVQVMSGKAKAGSRLKIFDNNVEMGEVTSALNGEFTYTTDVLYDGKHKIYIGLVNDAGKVSESSNVIEIVIDTSPADIMDLIIEPSSQVKAGSAVKVKISVEEELDRVSLKINGNVYEMIKKEDFYEAIFAAPIEFGEYNLNFALVDELGNESKIEGKTKIKVGGLLMDSVRPGNVTELRADAAENKVNLNWSAPNELDVKIVNYRIYYGISPNQLTEAIDTFDANASWEIRNLQNNTEYYFAVVAIDEKWHTSEEFSNIVSAIPKPLKPSRVEGVVLTPGENKITLSWIEAKAASYPIKNYRISYGVSSSKLDKTVDTFAKDTTWYIPNLQPGMLYHFVIVAVDERGNFSELASEIVSGVPLMPPPLEVRMGTDGEDAIGDLKKDPGEAGPEMAWLLGFSLVGGYLCRKRI